MMFRGLVDEMAYNEKGNEVRLIKYFSPRDSFLARTRRSRCRKIHQARKRGTRTCGVARVTPQVRSTSPAGLTCSPLQ